MGQATSVELLKNKRDKTPKAHVFLWKIKLASFSVARVRESHLVSAPSPGIIKDAEDVYGLKNPTLFIFAENDAVIPLEQVSWHLV